METDKKKIHQDLPLNMLQTITFKKDWIEFILAKILKIWLKILISYQLNYQIIKY